MNEYTLIGIILACIGVFKGKDVWDYLKHRTEDKRKDEMLEHKTKEIAALRRRIKKLEKLIGK